MSEELKQNEEIEISSVDEMESTTSQDPVTLAVPVPTAITIWNDDKALKKAMKAATFISRSAFAPPLYQNSPENCLIAYEMMTRTGLPALAVLQNLHVVQRKPCWSGAFCAALINSSGMFSKLSYKEVGVRGEPSWGIYATAIRNDNGERCNSEVITLKMAADEGWLNKPGSKWKTMPKQMMIYRAAAFFARAYCPEMMNGMQTMEEIQDVRGYEEEVQQTVVTLDEGGGKA
jgi:hypothetical protein